MLKHLLIFFIIVSAATAQPTDSKLLKEILENLIPVFSNIFSEPDQYKLQIIYTQVNRDQNNVPELATHTYRLKPREYFYPASTIKIPIAVLAMEKLNSIENIDRDTPLNILTEMPGLEGILEDKTSRTGLPSIAHYIHKLFVVSDNDASNRLFEFLRRDYLNQRLWDLGYTETRIRQRLGISLSEKQNRYTSSFRFFHDGSIIYEQPSQKAEIDLNVNYNDYLIGKAHMKSGKRVEQPFDFSKKNFMNLMEQHRFLIQVMFPETAPNYKQLNLTENDYQFLYGKMSLLPRESKYPLYEDDNHNYDGYCKFFMFGDTREQIPDHIRIYNKVGLAHGFLLDNAYVVDVKNKVEFFLSAVVYVNQNETLNDNTYEYDEISIPFLAALGNAFYRYELNRVKDVLPDLTRFEIGNK
jgi:hypothetical protein|tara:strand:- start:699 stop:1934 length:1236 start_codon:yes stop_codon:yes gene_type:complete